MLASRSQGERRSAQGGSWHSSLLSWEHSVALPASFACLPKVKWEASVFHFITSPKHVEKTQSLVQPETWALALQFSCFHMQPLPCRCSYGSWRAALVRCARPAGQPNWANFNLAVGYLEPGSHRSVNFWASPILTQPQSKIMLIHLLIQCWYILRINLCPLYVCMSDGGKYPAVAHTPPHLTHLLFHINSYWCTSSPQETHTSDRRYSVKLYNINFIACFNICISLAIYI